MIKHYIILASAYSIGKRIALDYSADDNLEMDKIQKDLSVIFKVCGSDVPVSKHFIQTESKSWDSVKQKDKFFANVELITELEAFIELLLKDRDLKGIDVAKYILTKIPCTHLKLEKLVYLCYADYLCDSKCKLFKDSIYAYNYGPIVRSVYEVYKKTDYNILKNCDEEDDSYIYDESDRKMSIRSRILASKDGVNKLLSIDKTLEKYGKLSAGLLVDLTHREASPWFESGFGKTNYAEISDELIIKNHKNEEL